MSVGWDGMGQICLTGSCFKRRLPEKATSDELGKDETSEGMSLSKRQRPPPVDLPLERQNRKLITRSCYGTLCRFCGVKVLGVSEVNGISGHVMMAWTQSMQGFGTLRTFGRLEYQKTDS